MKDLKNAIILHGKPSEEEYYSSDNPSESNSHWLPWLQNQLLIRDIAAATPEVPKSFKPDWDMWCREVERFEITVETIIVGHSCGGGFWVRYLSEHPELKVGKVVLVAPWLDPDGDETGSFFEFDIDPKLAERTQGITIFHSDNDMGNVHKSVAMLREKIENIDYREFHGYGHFCEENMHTVEFPELLKEVLAP
jgi:predicted alpha/beta hydrolase family esterase